MPDILKPRRFECLDELNGLRAGFLRRYPNITADTENIKEYLSDFDADARAFALDESSNSLADDLRSVFLVGVFGNASDGRAKAACDLNNPYPEDMFYEYATELAQEGSDHFENISVLRSFYLLLVSVTPDIPKARYIFREIVRKMLFTYCADFNVTPLPEWEKGAARGQISEVLRESYEFEQFYMQRDQDSDADYEEDMTSKQQIIQHQKGLFLNFMNKNMTLNQITDAILGDASKIYRAIRGTVRVNN